MISSSFRVFLAAQALLVASGAACAQVTNDTIPVNKHQYNLFNPTPRKYMRPMVPDRPGVTESPYTVDAGHFQVESDAFRLVNGYNGENRERDIYVNRMLAKIGLSDKTDLQVQLDSYLINKEWQAGESTPERHGRFGDVTVRLKRNLIGDDNSPFALGAVGYVLLPTGNSVGEGGTEAGLLLPAFYKLPKNWTLGAQAEAEWNYDRAEGYHFVLLTPTFTVDREFTKWLEGFAEIVGYWDTKKNQWRSSINVGPQFDIGDNLQLDFGTHLALNQQTDREYFIGVSFRR